MATRKRVWLITKRLEKGYSQKELAEKIGVSNRTLSCIETGERDPSGKLAYKLAEALEFDMAIFYQQKNKSV